MAKKNEPPLIILVDSREQAPYKFEGHQSETTGLKTGDYSVKGYEDVICVERKSKADAYGTFTHGRDRFVRELERMRKFPYAAMVIESSLENFLVPPAMSQARPLPMINSVLSWSIQYGVHVFFSCDRSHGNALTQRLLEKFWKHKEVFAKGS